MGRMKKKYESGEASLYLTRKAALKKLQLSLKAFRRLCILKGIYPREPKNRKRAQHGSTEKKTLYLKKDIQFLLHEPIIMTLRDHKVYMKKKARAKALRDFGALKHIIENKPTYKMDHIIKERYPTFIDALRDLDDCLTLCFLFSTFPSMRFVPCSISRLSRRLTVEFMHYIIEAKALRKVFVSIKGYYYQADVKGQTITWIVPHHFGFSPQSPDEVDFRIMATFVEFYNTLLGFINFRLCHSLNICYPPLLTTPKAIKNGEDGEDIDNKPDSADYLSEQELVSERVAALNQSLLRSAEANIEEEELKMDEFPSANDEAVKFEELKKEEERIKNLKKLYVGLKFFLNREVPREPLTFIIRCFGGEVSWDKDLFPGASFSENDETITHHIIDRNDLDQSKKYISRYYVQPQWIFDSVNARALLPVQAYFPGAILPPHVSPFPTEREGDYVPPEKKKFFDMENGITPLDLLEEEKEEDKEEDDEELDSEDEKIAEEKEDSPYSEDEDDQDEEKLRKILKKKMRVEQGKPEVIDYEKVKDHEDKEQHKLRVMSIKNKHKRLYKKMMDSRRRRRKEANKLETKRSEINRTVKTNSKSQLVQVDNKKKKEKKVKA